MAVGLILAGGLLTHRAQSDSKTRIRTTDHSWATIVSFLSLPCARFAIVDNFLAIVGGTGSRRGRAKSKAYGCRTLINNRISAYGKDRTQITVFNMYIHPIDLSVNVHYFMTLL